VNIGDFHSGFTTHDSQFAISHLVIILSLIIDPHQRRESQIILTIIIVSEFSLEEICNPQFPLF